ncbi:hypothetical protein [Janthinobacterium sp. LM6]|uniref:hypothetical protein n=1 Tax=Janthinobacterium sp. LM6 TaxID=1938606 RepID=UPI00123707C5|nr:hypothetical protein [Janthinobacterium sp. LM6]
MRRGNSAAGAAPKKAKVAIVLIFDVDENGKPIHDKYMYAVVTLGVPPQILLTTETFNEAVDWALNNGYQLDDTHQPS